MRAYFVTGELTSPVTGDASLPGMLPERLAAERMHASIDDEPKDLPPPPKPDRDTKQWSGREMPRPRPPQPPPPPSPPPQQEPRRKA